MAFLGTQEETPLLVDVLRWQGTVFRDRGETAQAERLYERSRRSAIALDYGAGQAHALNALGSIAQRRGDLERAKRLYDEAAALAARCGESRLRGMVRQNLGIIADIQGDAAAAMTHYTDSLRSFEAMNDAPGMVWVLNNLGLLHAKSGRFREAEASYIRALVIARERGDLMVEGVIEENRADLAIMDHQLGRALPAIERALEIAVQRGDSARRAAALKLRGVCHRLAGNIDAALEEFRLALTLSAISEEALVRAEILYEFGLASAEANDHAMARELWTFALQAFEQIGAREWVERVRDRLTNGDTAPTL